MKTTEEILTEMSATQAQFPVLDTLDSTSDTSFFLNLKKYWALLVQMLTSEFETFKTSVELLISTTSVGALSWYVDQVMAFQYGDAISILNGKVSYDAIDEQKKIVKQSTATEDTSSGRITIRAAKTGEGGYVALSTDELEALRGYVAKIKYAGVMVDVTSLEADLLKLVGVVKVDRQVFKPDGSLLTDPSKFPVRDAIIQYIANLPYTSLLSNTDLTDEIQKIKGVRDFTVTSSFTRRPISSDWISYNREVISTAGHMALHNDSLLSYQY
jgi:hypothetical protein